MTRWTRAILAAGTALAIGIGCDDDQTAPGEVEAVAGTYALVSVDGAPLPAVLQESGNDKVELLAGTVAMDDDGTFTAQSQLRITLNGAVTPRTDQASGTWTLNGDTVRFDPDVVNSPDFFMTWDGADRLSQTLQGHTVVFER